MTHYEVVLEHADKGRYLHCYSAQKSRDGIISAMRDHHYSMEKFIGTPFSSWRTAGTATDGIVSDNGWTLRFSGRTRLDAKTEGELPWYRDQDVCVPS